jgi:hypothetical protein
VEVLSLLVMVFLEVLVSSHQYMYPDHLQYHILYEPKVVIPALVVSQVLVLLVHL